MEKYNKWVNEQWRGLAWLLILTLVVGILTAIALQDSIGGWQGDVAALVGLVAYLAATTVLAGRLLPTRQP